mmetsp:Transcript_9847/g.26224  ORF Transcript_9847/g.26224 Transcript_9847/m.26224 type:complete len:129 (+) Transcript_9847:225-611(+)
MAADDKLVRGYQTDGDALRALISNSGGMGVPLRAHLYGQDDSIVELRFTLLLKEIERLKTELSVERRERAVQDLALRHIWQEITALRCAVNPSGPNLSAAKNLSDRSLATASSAFCNSAADTSAPRTS